MIAALIAVATLLIDAPARAQQDDAGEGRQRLYVGRTGIQCLRLPCPHRGIFLPGLAGSRGLRRPLLYADVDGKTSLPRLAASPGDKRRLEAAWDRRACLEIIGRLEGKGASANLTVTKIVGPCR